MKVKNLSFHIGFWIIYTLIWTVIQAKYKEQYFEAFAFELVNMPMRLLVVYFNYFVLIPKLLLEGKTVKYFAYTIATIIISGFIQRFINFEAAYYIYEDVDNFGLWLPYKFLQTMMVIASPLVFLGGMSIIWKVSELQKTAKILENEKLQSELKYLRSQINPHFLFNTLNNIYGLSLENSPKTSELILKLSDFLSFSLYESNQKLIPIDKEIDLMNDFIALEMSRFEDRVEINIRVPDNLGHINIPPLIFVPFVENAFKHSLKNETGIASIDIRLKDLGGYLQFKVVNSKPNDVVVTDTKQGLGLLNIRKRLDIIYGKDYSLSIVDEDLNYEITLEIKL